MGMQTANGTAQGGMPARLTTLGELSSMTMFAIDLDWRSKDDVEKFEAGQLLEKSGAIMAGTRKLSRPLFPERLLVFAEHASFTYPIEDDPWELVALDRKAYFAVGDAYDDGEVVQYAIVEISEDEAAVGEPVAFDGPARAHVRNLLARSYSEPAPPYARDEAFLFAMGKMEEPSSFEKRLFTEPVWPLDLDWLRKTRARRASGEGLSRLQVERQELEKGAPAHDLVKAEWGMVRCRAKRRRDDADEALIAIEARLNLDILADQLISDAAVRQLYAGDRLPLWEGSRATLTNGFALQPAEQLTCNLWLSSERSMAIGELDAHYELRKMESPDSVVDAEWFAIRRERLGDMFDGDVDACAEELKNRLGAAKLPYRLELSCSPDLDSRAVKANVFLPPRAAYPLSGPKKKSRLDVGPYNEGRFEALYSEASCSLALSAALLMKGFFPWAGRVRLCAWAREEGEVRCLVALDAGEEALVSVERFPSSEAPRILKGLGAAIDRGRDKVLRPVEPLFRAEDAMDYIFGFARLYRGWPLPVCIEQDDEIPLDDDTYMMRGLMAVMLERGGMAGDVKGIAEEQIELCEAAWLKGVRVGVRLLSCDGRLNEEVVRGIAGEDGIAYLSHGLADLHSLLAGALNELGDFDGAREEAGVALSLNPGSFRAHMLLADLDAIDEDHVSARRQLDEAHRFAQSAGELCEVFRAEAFLASRGGDPGLAEEWLLRALNVGGRDDENVAECLDLLDDLKREFGFDVSARTVGLACTGEADASAGLIARGLQPGLSPEVEAAARRGVGEMLAGGRLCDEPYVDAYVLAENMAGRQVPEARRLVEMTAFSPLGEAPEGDWEGKPVAILDHDLILDFEHALDNDDYDHWGSCPVAVPYNDGMGGLLLEMRGLVDTAGERVAARVASREWPVIRMADYGKLQFRLLRPECFPELGFGKEGPD